MEPEDWLTRALGPVADYLHCYAVTDASRRAAAAFRPRPSDVLIATYTKSGTTVLQQLLEMLRARGDMSFDEITEAQPWLDFCHDIGVDVYRLLEPQRTFLQFKRPLCNGSAVVQSTTEGHADGRARVPNPRRFVA